MKITIIQTKPQIGNVTENFKIVADLIKCVSDTDVVVLPELWSTGYYPEPIEKFADMNGQQTVNFISHLSKQYNLNIIAGSVIVKVGTNFFNRCFVSDRLGRIIAIYDKSHLFSQAKENKIFTPGKEVVTVEIDDIRCGLAICYDLRFPEFIRRMALQGIEILFVPAAWSLRRLIPRQILTKARAIENQIFVVFVNSSGKSEILNPIGEIIAETGLGNQILTCEIDLNFRKEVIDKMNLLDDRNLFTDS